MATKKNVSQKVSVKHPFLLTFISLTLVVVGLALSIILVNRSESTNNAAQAACVQYSYQCSGKGLYKCISGVWKLQTACSSTKTCSVSYRSCIDVCPDGSYRCTSNNFQWCTNDKWTTMYNCGTYTCTTGPVPYGYTYPAGYPHCIKKATTNI